MCNSPDTPDWDTDWPPSDEWDEDPDEDEEECLVTGYAYWYLYAIGYI